MVQVDVIWSYAYGASFAAAATRELAHEREAFGNRYYMLAMLFLGIFFAPSGLYLLTAFPAWETMQVVSKASDLSPLLVTFFGVTNVTQGIIGFWVGWRFSRRHEYYKAHLNWMIAWVVFWFVLVSGWDTTGYQRFLYDPVMNNGVRWQAGQHNGWSFFTGPVFLTLLAMGAVFVPMLSRGIFRVNYEILRKNSGEQFRLQAALGVMRRYVYSWFGVTLLLAIGAAMIVRTAAELTGSVVVGYLLGLPLSATLIYVIAIPKGRLFHWIASPLYGGDHDPSKDDGGNT